MKVIAIIFGVLLVGAMWKELDEAQKPGGSYLPWLLKAVIGIIIFSFLWHTAP